LAISVNGLPACLSSADRFRDFGFLARLKYTATCIISSKRSSPIL